MYYSRMASVIYDICRFFRKTYAFGVSSLQLLFFIHPYRTRRIAAKLRNLYVTSTKAVAMAASCTTWSIASWSRTAPSARSSWSRRTGATRPAAGRPCSDPSARPAPTEQAPPLATGQVRPNHSHHFSLVFCSFIHVELLCCLFHVVWSMITMTAVVYLSVFISYLPIVLKIKFLDKIALHWQSFLMWKFCIWDLNYNFSAGCYCVLCQVLI